MFRSSQELCLQDLHSSLSDCHNSCGKLSSSDFDEPRRGRLSKATSLSFSMKLADMNTEISKTKLSPLPTSQASRPCDYKTSSQQSKRTAQLVKDIEEEKETTKTKSKKSSSRKQKSKDQVGKASWRSESDRSNRSSDVCSNENGFSRQFQDSRTKETGTSGSGRKKLARDDKFRERISRRPSSGRSPTKHSATNRNRSSRASLSQKSSRKLTDTVNQVGTKGECSRDLTSFANTELVHTPYLSQCSTRVDTILVEDLWSDSSRIVVAALRELHLLCQSEQENQHAAATETLRTVGCPTLVGVSRKWHDHIGILRESLRLFAFLLEAKCNEEFCLIGNRMGLMSIITRVMARYSKEETILEIACTLVSRMVSCSVGKRPTIEFLKLHGLPLLLQTKDSFSANETISNQATIALCSMARYESEIKEDGNGEQISSIAARATTKVEKNVSRNSAVARGA